MSDPIFIVLYMIFAIPMGALCIYGIVTSFTDDPKRSPVQARAWTPEEYDQDATRLRAASRHAEEQANYNEKLARMKLKAAELAEVEQFVASERAKVVNATASTKKQ
jgi:hypothetical protein